MHFLHLTLASCLLAFFSTDPASERKSIGVKPATTTHVVPGAANIMLQSNDGGLTWQDISQDLPVNEQPEDFFAAGSDLYLRVKKEMYRSKGGLQTPVWEKETVPFVADESINSTRPLVRAFNYSEGQVYQQAPEGTWSPIHAKFKTPWMPMIFKTSDGTLFYSSDGGLYRSTDTGRSWKTVLKGRGIAMLVEENSVLVGTTQTGIIRSTDNGETWEPVISEGGVGIAIEHVDGGIAAISYNVSTKTRRIRFSSDSGKTWRAIDEGIQSLSISSIKQMDKYLIVGHPDGIFRSADMGKTWSLVHPTNGYVFKLVNDKTNNVHSGSDSVQVVKGTNTFSDDNQKVFEIYKFRNVLYAVARPFGC
jgi:photosystem II stability/assembly factor-like uncharacterized protein